MTIIDPMAQSEEELKDSYVGKVILDCSICHSKIYKNADEVVLGEESDEELANIGEECPYCHSVDGYLVIGQVAEFDAKEDSKEEESEDEESKEDSEEKEIESTTKVEEECKVGEAIKSKRGLNRLKSVKESFDKKFSKAVKEDLNKVEIETDKEKMSMTAEENGKVTVTTEPKEEEPKEENVEVVAPLQPETEDQFKEPKEDSDYEDIEIDEIEEKDFDELGESYLKRVYENVKGFKTTKATTNKNTLKLEGVITFKSGKKAATKFVFESQSIDKNRKVKFVGLNEQFAKGKKTFTLTGTVSNNKLVCESLVYNYTAKDSDGKSKRLYGRVSK